MRRSEAYYVAQKAEGYRLNASLDPSVRPHRLAFTDTMDPRTLGQLSIIWLLNKTNPEEIGPLGVFLPVGLYGKIPGYLS
jgi:hypothetical protein